MQRRDFLKSAAAIAALMALREEAIAAPGEIPRRTLGRTGQSVSIIGIGGYHIGARNVSEAGSHPYRPHGLDPASTSWTTAGTTTMARASAAWAAPSERLPAKSLPHDQNRRPHPRRRKKQLEESLRRLKTDHIDLLQIHEVIRPGRSRAGLPPRLCRRCPQTGAESRQDPLHRLHRSQKPGDPSQHDRDRGPPWLHLRHCADAPQRHGRALRQLHHQSASCRAQAQHGHPRHEAHRQQPHPGSNTATPSSACTTP